jgi:hypothetical protein
MGRGEGEFKESFLFRPTSYIIKVSRKLMTEVGLPVPTLNYIHVSYIVSYTNNDSYLRVVEYNIQEYDTSPPTAIVVRSAKRAQY